MASTIAINSSTTSSATSNSTNTSASKHQLYSYQPASQRLLSAYCSCTKFVPQAFNNNKCQQCFNLKDMHSAEALAEFSKSNRKVCKFGYLFIAPPDLELNKTKRWQWRFFIFYDDSELTYSLDENPLTLPQGRINISKCDDIIELSNNSTDLGGLSSYQNSLCLKFSPPNKDIYIAAGNYEEMSKWRDVLGFHCQRHHSVSTIQLKTYQETNSKEQDTRCKAKNGKKIETNIDQLEDFDNIDDINENDDIDENEINAIMNNNMSNTIDESDPIYDEHQAKDDEFSLKLNKTKLNSKYYSSYESAASKNIKLKMMSELKRSANTNYQQEEACIDEKEHNEAESPSQENMYDSSSNNSNESGTNRRLSYKEDDLLRKQRLKENLNQLLIEYKHEEEAHLKKYSKFSNTTSTGNLQTNTSNPANRAPNRTSLDSCYPASKPINTFTKSSAFTLVPSQNSQTNSAFRPVNHNISTQVMKSSKLGGTSQIKATNNNNSSSSSSSWSSSCSSSSSSSSSPPKTRSANANTNPIELTGLNEQSNYKKPCLISPRKAGNNPASLNPINENKPAQNEEQYPNTDSSTTLSSSSSCSSSNLLGNKSLTIVVRNNSLDEQGAEAKTAKPKPTSSPAAKTKQDGLDSSDSSLKQSSTIEIIDLTKANRIAQRVNKSSIVSNSSAAAGISGYLWKSKESLDAAPSLSHQFEKYWFSLNANLCCLVYWHDKYEQDLGKLPLGKYELIKCTQVVKDHLQPQFYHNHYSNMQSLNESLDFKLCFHQNTTFIVLRAMSPDNKASWCDTLRHTIENNSSVCSKCKPKLVVNPMPLMAFTSSSVNVEDAQKRNNVKQSALACKQSSSLLSPSRVSKPKSKTELTDVINESSSSSSPSVSYLSTPDQPSQFDSLKQQHEKLVSENAEISSKFKLLEQIHLDTISEYDKQQAHLFNQIEDMHLKANKTEHEIENLTKRLNQTKVSYDSSLVQINALNSQLSEYKETIQSQEKEISRLNTKIQQLSEAKDVKHLETRITDVLEKMKEREAVSNNEESLRIKCDKLQSQLQESQAKIAQLNTHIKQHERSTPKSVNLVDFSDDLGKVLMSKEEVITQLERQLKDKEKQIQTLTEQLNEEIAQTSKYQDALNSEMNRNTELNNELKTLNANLSEQYVCMDELDALKEQLTKSNLVIESLEFNFNQASLDKEKFESELKSLQEYSRNEIETLQEEVKTLEYKLVHSQRQAQEYQSLLEDMDLANSNSVSFLSQTLTSCGGSLSSIGLASLNDSANTSLQNRLKRNQSYVQQIVQQIIELKNASIDELKARSTQLQAELDEVREENVDLNDHIYSIDVFMREKEALCDQYQKERDDIFVKIKEKNAEIEELKSLSSRLKLDEKKLSHTNKYEQFVNNLKDDLLAKTKNLTDFVGYALSICNCLLKLDANQSLDGIDEAKLLDLLISSSKPISASRGAELKAFKSSIFESMKVDDKLVLNELKQSLKKLIDLINSSELSKCNTQIVSYMAEQLVHKAALNGHLKFACELLRKKNEQNTNSSASNATVSPQGAPNNNTSPNHTLTTSTLSNEQDEKVFKLASELLLSDEDSLRKLSAQVLNEAQHLTQLNCVLSSLKKIRWKYLKQNNSESLNEIVSKMSPNEDMELIDQETGDRNEDNDKQLGYILDVIRDVFVQHKFQISEQLNEVHKLMSISSDDDLLAHLQNQNAQLQQEVNKLKAKGSSNGGLLMAQSNHNPTTQLRKFGALANKNTQQASNPDMINNEHHHILNDLLSQDDTMC